MALLLRGRSRTSLGVSAALAATVAVAVAGCGPSGGATLTLTATPSSIGADGQTTTISVVATDAAKAPGTGSVTLFAPAGTLSAGRTLVLGPGGTASTDFACPAATHEGCTGSIWISGRWTPGTAGATEVRGGVSVTVTSGADAGRLDAGTGGLGPNLDGGVTDGGYFGAYRLWLAADKGTLLEGTLDRAVVTATLKLNTAPPQPASGRPVTLSVPGGTASFDSNAPLASVSVMTDAQGVAAATVYTGAATAGTLPLVARAEDAQETLALRVLRVETLAWKSDPTTLTTLAIKSTGRGFSTPVFFQVKDADGKAVQGVEVSFSLSDNSAAGSSLTPALAHSDATGAVKTVLSAGDSQGTSTVIARVLGLAEVRSPSFGIVIGWPSDGRLQVTCARKSLGALETVTPPRNDQSTVCRADFTDRNGVEVPFDTTFSWLTEQGQIDATSTSAANSGFATATFETGGALPVETTPLPGEPEHSGRNPRDRFVTVVAAADGEEQYWDGSGSGVGNGTWDPGEWWVDLPEPFVDANDNGTWDPGEPFIDTDRVDCTTGEVIPKNQRWDGPNGCWDGRTKIWRATHIVYTGMLVDLPEGTPFFELASPLPDVVPVGAAIQVGFRWFDPYFNRLSSDGSQMTLTTIPGTRGTAALSVNLAGESFGHELEYVTIRGRDAGTGFTDDGPCDLPLPSAMGNARCLRTYKFTAWRSSPIGGIITFTNPTAQTKLPDGGTPPPTMRYFQLEATNSLASGPARFPFQVGFE